MSAAATEQPPSSAWKGWLVLLGIALAGVAVATELVILFADYDKVVVTDGSTVTTTTKGSAPAGGIVTGSLGLAVACFLAAFFGDRITKLSVAGVELELNPVVAAKLGEAARRATMGNPELFTSVYIQAADMLKRGLIKPGNPDITGRSAVEEENALVADAVSQAARQSGLPH